MKQSEVLRDIAERMDGVPTDRDALIAVATQIEDVATIATQKEHIKKLQAVADAVRTAETIRLVGPVTPHNPNSLPSNEDWILVMRSLDALSLFEEQTK